MLGANLGLSCTCLPEKLCDVDTAAVSCCKKIGAQPEKCGGGGGRYYHAIPGQAVKQQLLSKTAKDLPLFRP